MPRSRVLRVLLVVSAVAYSGFLVTGPSARAGTNPILVSTTTDEFGSGKGCALREAVQAANTNQAFGGCPAGTSSSVDLITVPTGTYELTLTGPGENANATGDIDITEAVDITGAGRNSTIVDGHAEGPGSCQPNRSVENQGNGAPDRVFHIHLPEPPPEVSAQGIGFFVNFSDMEITSGEASDGTGGGVYAESGLATLEFEGVDVTNNTAFGEFGSGGGIASFAEGTHLENTSVTGNVVSSAQIANGGGLLAVSNVVRIEGGDLVENEICADSANGGGLYAEGWVAMLATDVLSNRAFGNFTSGAGISLSDSSGDGLSGGDDPPRDSISSVLIADNIARGPLARGGGISTEGFGLTLDHVWVDNNRAESSGSTGKGPSPVALGGGLFAWNTGPIEIVASTFERNSAVRDQVQAQAQGGDGLEVGGGGIYSETDTELLNSTISDNRSELGAGLYHSENDPKGSASARLTHVTVANNDAAHGGGIFVDRQFKPASRLRLDSTIVHNPQGGGNCEGQTDAIRSLGNNMASSGTCNLTKPTDHPNTNPQLEP
ncbi:MAG: CSLREA domain-containing protein, partial [Actinomycetota bacterium]|nr:CSLREA domain-containing protein [Actinomycetota bacterium]